MGSLVPASLANVHLELRIQWHRVKRQVDAVTVKKFHL